MSQPLDFLSDSEVRQINSLIDTLDRSSFDYLQIDVGDIKVTIGKGMMPIGGQPGGAMGPVNSVPMVASGSVAAPPSRTAESDVPRPEIAKVTPVPVEEPSAGWRPIKATTMGRFYSRPDPSSPPFVKAGDHVTADSTVGLIEVMKLFNAVPAGVDGTIAQVCVEEGGVVEFGQILFYVTT